MAEDRLTSLERKIIELEFAMRNINVGGVRLPDVAEFSAGSCTNNCTAACTIGCTQGCTGGGCAPRHEGPAALQPQASVAEGGSGARLYSQLAKGA